ncbi:putative extracellular protein [Phytophthora megakarya]|uniref:Putative extracellular protein n=1 Tax=Phytophthora megakarya TaxID=4795 RepID=A0A225VT95_9STRA|nr:putative extracellular protein [Phytophthora megakarya]
MLMGEILMSLKRDTPAVKVEQSATYRTKMTGLSVEVSLPSTSRPGGDSPADVFSFDAFNSVSPMAFKLPLHPAIPSVASPARTITPRGGSKRYGPVVQLEDLREYLRECFNMPIAAVARKFGICATLLKKICRRHGIQRWPHRQIRSLQKSIDMLRESLSVAKGTNKEYIAKKIAAFEYTLECIMQDPNTAAKGISAGRLASPATEEMVKRGNRAKNRKKAAARAALSDDEERASKPTAAPVVAPPVQDWTADNAAPGPDAQRLNTRRASVPMSLQSILC